jgi:hypothetical protein
MNYTNRSKLRRILFLLYFFVPVAVALACGAAFARTTYWMTTNSPTSSPSR